MFSTVSSVPFLLLNIQIPILIFTLIFKFDMIFTVPRVSLTVNVTENNFHSCQCLWTNNEHFVSRYRNVYQLFSFIK